MSRKEKIDLHADRKDQVDALQNRVATIDAKMRDSKAALRAWAASENAALDEIEERLRDQDEAIDVQELGESNSPVPLDSHSKEIDDLLARADELIFDAKKSQE